MTGFSDLGFGSLRKLGAPRRWALTDLGHFLLYPELPDFPGTQEIFAEKRMNKQVVV